MSASPLALELKGIPNPFRSGITRDAWDPEWVDVAEIHAEISARICTEVETIRQYGGSRGVLVFGEPGSGKTHLLNRLRNWCLQNGALFSGFRLQCAPQTIWRHLRREFAGDLLHPLPGGTRQLDVLLNAGEDRIRQTCSYALAAVLLHLRDGRFRREGEAWLRGDRLPDSILESMGITDRGELEEEAEDEARRVLKELIALAAPAPVVMALDQVEAMMLDSGDLRGLWALGTAVAALRDESANLVLVTCAQTGFLDVLHRGFRHAEMDRMGEVRLELYPLDVVAARRLLAARLDAEPALRDHRYRKTQPLWPFTEYAIKHLLVPEGHAVARRLIYSARDLFEELRGMKAARPPRDAARFLDAELHARTERARERTEWTGNEFLLDAVQRVMPLAGWKSVEPRPQGVDLLLEKNDRRLMLVMFNQATMHGAARRLERLAQLEQTGRLRLLRATGLPVGRRAPKTAHHLAQLEARGARLVRLSRETMAVLEACRTLLADAAAGDLHVDGETLGREFVEQWLRERFPQELRDWLEGLESGAAPAGGDEALMDALVDCVRQEKVIPVEEAARRLGCGAEEVRRCARQTQDVVAALGEPSQVLYERLGG